jgi:hypothetical protein
MDDEMMGQRDADFFWKSKTKLSRNGHPRTPLLLQLPLNNGADSLSSLNAYNLFNGGTAKSRHAGRVGRVGSGNPRY